MPKRKVENLPNVCFSRVEVILVMKNLFPINLLVFLHCTITRRYSDPNPAMILQLLWAPKGAKVHTWKFEHVVQETIWFDIPPYLVYDNLETTWGSLKT